MTLHSLHDYTADITARDVATIGDVTFYSVSGEVTLKHADLLDRLTAVGLEKFAPTEPRDDDTFLRATSSVERRRQPVPGTETFENFLVRQVSRANGRIVKQIVVETVDAGNKRLDYAPAAQLEFDGSRAWLHPLGDDHPRAMTLAQQAIDTFLAWRGMLTADHVRRMISAVITSGCRATSLRDSGGVYFVLDIHRTTLESLISVVNTIPGASVAQVPLIDTTDFREWIRQSYVDESVGEIHKLNAEMRELLEANEPIGHRRFSSIALRIKELTQKGDDYQRFMSTEASVAELHMEALERNRRQLLGLVK